jgi:hypothetical protein
VSWEAIDNVALDDNALSFVTVTYNGDDWATVGVTTDFSTITFTTVFVIGYVYKEDGTPHIRIAGNNRRASAFGRTQSLLPNVEAQTRIPFVFVESVTGKTVVRQNRPDIPVKSDFFGAFRTDR